MPRLQIQLMFVPRFFWSELQRHALLLARRCKWQDVPSSPAPGTPRRSPPQKTDPRALVTRPYRADSFATELCAPAFRLPCEGWATRRSGWCRAADGTRGGSFGTLRKACPRHTDWFFFFLLRVFVVRGVFFFALFLLAFFLLI